MLPMFLALAVAAAPTPDPVPAGEEAVAPYIHVDANAGAAPFTDKSMWTAFHGEAGLGRLVDAFVARNQADPRIGDIFKGQDLVRLRRMLREQFCYILNGGCSYSGRSMTAAHRDLGVQEADMGPLVENLQAAMRAEGVPFAAQNRFLAKLAPMKRQVVQR